MTQRIFAVTAGVCILLACATDIRAQATAQISGTARDQSGAVLPGVEITATQTETGIARMTVTNETGSYALPNLVTGPYKLEAGLPGFRTFVQTGIVLQVNADVVINPALEVGQVSEQVEVQANAALVETRSSGIGQVVENARILELPLNGRNVVDLIGLAGGTAPAPIANGSSRDSFATASYSVAGGLNTGLTYTLDGGHHQNPADNGYAPLPFPDALQEFKVETSATSAQKGMKSAGAVSLVTKSGTNEMHGDVFEFVRNYDFNARNAFATRRDSIKRNQFGGTFGGPILKNKLFLFAGYQGMTLRQDPADTTAFVPTAAMLTGDFTTFASAACNGGRATTLKAPFVSNRVDPKLFSPAALKLAAHLPQTSDPCGKVIFGSPVQTNEHVGITRLDYQGSANHSIFVRYLADSKVTPASYDINHNVLSIGNADNALAQMFTIGDTYLFGANVVNAFRVTTNRIAAGKFEPNGMSTAGVGAPALGVKAFTYSPYTSDVNVSGAFTWASHGGPTRTAIFAGSDDVSVLRGKHELGFGTNLAMWWANSYSGQYFLPWIFNGQTTGTGLSDLLLGDVSSVTNAPVAAKNKRGITFSLYAADSWKVTPRWTLNYGLRWEPYFPLLDLKGGPSHFDLNSFLTGLRSTQFDNTPAGIFFPHDPGFPNREGQYTNWKHFSPRVGFAWDVKGDGRTALRASFGSSYDFPHTQYSNFATQPPYNPRYSLTTVNFDNPWANVPGGDPFPLPYGSAVGRNAPWPLTAIVFVTDYNTPNMQVYQWNFNVQQQVGRDWVVSAGYLGTHSIHMWSTQQYNPALYIPGNCSAGQYGLKAAGVCSTTANQDQRRRLFLENPQVGQYYGYMPRVDSGGTGSYNGLILSVQRRPVKGVTLISNYTWSHCISDPAGATLILGNANNDSWTNPDNRHADRGNCVTGAQDQRHIFNLSAVAATPQFSQPMLRKFASGWSFSPIFKAFTGQYVSITTSQDRALNSTPNQRINQVLGTPYGNKTAGNYLNPAAFTLPDLGTFGSAGFGSIAGPGWWQFDAALSRSFRLRESQRIEFRAEAFNVTNSVHYNLSPGGSNSANNGLVTNFNAGNFGQITSAFDPRIMQFALKYVF